MIFKRYGAKSNEIQLGLHYGENPSKLNPFLTKKGYYYRIVNTLAERDALPAAERSFGMRVVVVFDPTPINNGKYVLANVNLGGANNNVLDNTNFIVDGGGFIPSGTALEYIKGDGTYGDFASTVAAISWSPGGNLFGAEAAIGTNDTFDLPIVTDGNEVARFKTNGDFGIGVNPTARLHARGVDATSSNYVLKLENIAGNPVIYGRNDGNVYIKSIGGFAADVTLGVSGAAQVSGLRTTGYQQFRYGTNDLNTGDARPIIEWSNSTTNGVFLTGIKSDDVWGIFCAGAGDWGFEINRTNRDIGISMSPLSTSKVAIKGNTSNSAESALQLRNSANATLFEFYNNGWFVAALPTSSAGLPSRALWDNAGVVNITP